MQEIELKKLWQTSNEQLEKSLNVIAKQGDEIQELRLQSYLSSMKPIKIFTILIGIIWVGTGLYLLSHIYIYGFEQANKFFLFSGTIQILLTLIALIFYVFQLITIESIDVTEPVLKTQREIAKLKTSTLWVVRILFLQLPVWTTFYWNESMLQNGNWTLWIIQAVVTLLFTYAAIWIFFNVKYENKDKKWFQLIFKGKEWTPLMKSMELLDEIDAYKPD